ncbi:MAG: MBL fold metallo-hydrolase [Parasporobacterium sp.]|nr:MBL fold metallo-hydrolase [Parasporobacterium sp.]
MRFLNIASGSGGNATYIGTEDTHLLIDSGVSRKRIVDGLHKAGISLSDIDAILVTHEHIDHIASLGILERTKEIPVYATEGTIQGILSSRSIGNFNKDVLHSVKIDSAFRVGDIEILPLKVDHDANDPVCYRMDSASSSCAIVTDLGEANEYLFRNLRNLDLLMLESNHDVRMLETGPYPYPLKMRILGKYGHLSNENSGIFLSRLLHDEIKQILLGHISKENNTRELAKLAVENEVDASDTKYRSGDFEIKTLRQDLPSEVLEV